MEFFAKQAKDLKRFNGLVHPFVSLLLFVDPFVFPSWDMYYI